MSRSRDGGSAPAAAGQVAGRTGGSSTGPLAGQVALVTGASRGIGRAIAMELARQGATVVGTATSGPGAEAIGAALTEAGATGRGAVLDVTDPQAGESLIEAIASEFGTPTILVNNAGITRDNLAMRMKDDEWEAVVDTNLSAVFRMSRGVMRGMMKARTGRIVNITSVVGSSGNAGQANYAAAKAGVAGMTRALARELGSRNITVNCIAPGFIDTDMTRALNEVQTSALVQQIPLGRFGQPDDIAAAVAFLCSPQAAYITGVTLHVNGGMYME
jgi:3-oxoacyl-[acyl-carrier protein] reductase